MASGTISDVQRARRVLTFGVCGSGKSMLAQQIADRIGVPYVSIDDICWDPGWVQASPEELDARVIPVLQRDAYAVDSVYRRHNALALERVDVIVGLDYPRLVSLARLLRRTVRRVIRREPCCNGNIETLGRALSRDSIIAWHFRSFASKRERIREWEANPMVPPVVRLKRPRDAEALLAALAPLRASDRERRRSGTRRWRATALLREPR